MTKIGLDKKELRFPRFVIEPMLQAVVQQDVSLDEMLEQLGTTRAQFNESAFSADAEQLTRLFSWLRHRTGARLGLRNLMSYFSATSAGLIGMAALSASNVRESLLVAVRYLPLLMPVMRADLEEDSRRVRFTVEMTSDLGDLNKFMFEVVIAAISIISDDVMARRIPRTVHFTHGYGSGERALAHMQELEAVMGAKVVLNSTFNGMEGDASDLDTPTRSPNDATFNTVKRILENEISAQHGALSFTDVARNELVRLANNGQFPALEAFADHMNLSPRTLIRKLSREDTSFKQLTNEVWFRLARELLSKTQYSVKQVAARTGFTNANSFSRAFKTQAGKTPLAWRKEATGQQ